MTVVGILLMAAWIVVVLYVACRWFEWVSDQREKWHPREKRLSILDPGDEDNRERSEDGDDIRVSQSRSREKRVPLEEAKVNLMKSGRLPHP